jgi:uncharacterized membrane protein YfcA
LAFVATSTAIGVLVDLVRTPVYLARTGEDLLEISTLVVVCVMGVLLGTVLGERLLFGLSRERFRTVVSLAIGVLGIWFLLGPIGR